jgi:predicted ferric reductase
LTASVTVPSTAAEKPGKHAKNTRRRSTRRGDLAGAAAGIGFGLAVGSALVVVHDNWHLKGGVATSLGTIAAVAGTYLCLALMVLISRVPWLEREVGYDRMVRWHRWVAPYSLLLITAHVALTTFGYGQSEGKNFFKEFWYLVTAYPWMLPATVAFVLMILLGVMSYRKIRNRMKYETWWTAHLYFYLAVILAFGHQLTSGVMFSHYPVFRYAWVGLYIFVAALIVFSRIIVPLSMSLRRGLRVGRVVEEAPGIVSVYIVGRDLVHLSARGGQFFEWRFLTRHWWWQAHPYSLSAGPRNTWLRITVKDLGDQSKALATHLKPGTRVVAEGPYGVFTAGTRETNKVVAFAAGIGITPIRAVLDDLPRTTDVTLIYRVAGMEEIPLRTELEELARASGWHFWYLPGDRQHYPMTVNFMSQFAPDLQDSDVYVCGPEGFTDSVVELARVAGVPSARIHHESFVF